MPQQDDSGRQVDHAEEVIGMTLPSRDDAAEVMKPDEQPLDLPAPTFVAKRPVILGFRVTRRVVRRDKFDVAFGGEVLVEAVVGRVANQPRGFFEEARGEGRVNEGDFMRRSAGHVDGDSHDFAVFTDFAASPRRVGPTAEPPFSPS